MNDLDYCNTYKLRSPLVSFHIAAFSGGVLVGHLAVKLARLVPYIRCCQLTGYSINMRTSTLAV